MSAPVVENLLCRLFGPFEALVGGQPVKGLQSRGGEKLLAYLILHHAREQTISSVAKMLWPHTGSVASLRQSVYHVRLVLGEEAYRLQNPSRVIRFDVQGAEIDVIAFDVAIERGDPESLEAATQLYRGHLLQGFTDAWIQKEREKRRESYLTALQSLAAYRAEQNDFAASALYLNRFIKIQQADEHAWYALMNAYVQCGERTAAINTYKLCREHLITKYKIDPLPGMIALYEQLTKTVSSPPKTTPVETKFFSAEPTETPKSPTGELRSAPTPTGGAVPLDSHYYVERPEDTLFCTALIRRDSVVLVKGPRQTGKTSLLARGLQQAREQGMRVILTDLQKLSASHWESSDTFYRALAQNLADQLELIVAPGEMWSVMRGANENFERYVRLHVLGKDNPPLVWGLDEVDRLFTAPFSSEVFALFRSWHNERALDPTGPWERLTIAMAYATEAHLFISDLNQSPFNVGTRLPTQDFTLDQVGELNSRHGSPLADSAQTARYYRFVGGNPFLLHRGLQVMVTQKTALPEFEKRCVQDDGCYGDHLKRMWLALSKDAGLCDALRAILRGQPCPSSDSFYRLRSAGLVTGDDPGAAQVRCQLYAIYLEAHLS